MLQRLALCFAVLPCAALTTFAQTSGFTLQQVMSAPFCSELQAAPKGDRILWIANEQGKRNVYVAEHTGASYTVHRVTNDNADDGIDIGDVTWTPDGESVVYVRGGDFEFPEKPSPNPDFLPQGVAQEIWIVGAHGENPRKLADGRSPEVSPDGSTVAYLSGGQIWTVNLRETSAKPAQLLHTRGDLSSLTWSPDGKYLAFASKRQDHGFIGVYSLTASILRYLAPST